MNNSARQTSIAQVKSTVNPTEFRRVLNTLSSMLEHMTEPWNDVNK